MSRRLLVTGGCGFVGSALVRALVAGGDEVWNLDRLTYAGSLDAVAGLAATGRHHHHRLDIADRAGVARLLAEARPDAVVHLAAETHVDRSLDDPTPFVATNVLGTLALLEAVRAWWAAEPAPRRERFRFVQVSTDEVFGSLAPAAPPFGRTSPYRPSSPYAASKAGADHLARAWQVSFGLPVIVTACTNNYGPFQHPEKLLPVLVLNALAGRPLPLYGAGDQRRDWLFVDDHAAALGRVLAAGRPGTTYLLAGGAERTNRALALAVCDLLDEFRPGHRPHARLIAEVADRPGHDRRYALDAGPTAAELGWRPAVPLAAGLRRTVAWYLEHTPWCRTMLAGAAAPPRQGLPSPPAG